MARHPHIVVAGLDFGTSYTKCIVRNLAFPDQAHVVPFSHNGRKQLWVPSIVYRMREGNSHQTSLQTSSNDAEQVPYIKMRLLGLIDKKAAAWRPEGAEAAAWYLKEAEADAAFFLSHVLRDVAVRIHEIWGDFGSNAQDMVLVNVCIPVQHAEIPAVEARFRIALVKAYLATNFNSPARERPDRTEVAGVPIGDARFQEAYDRCNTYPETSANLQAFLKSPSRQNGLFIMADVGGGTVDVSIFEYNDKGTPYALTYYHNEVIPAGSSQHELRMAKALAAAGAEPIPLRQLTAWKERRIVPDGANVGELEELLDKVRNEIKFEVGAAVGACIAATMSAFGGTAKSGKERILNNGRFFFAGGGFRENPYEQGARFFETRWSMGAAETNAPVPPPLKSLRIPVPSGLEFPDSVALERSKVPEAFSRLTVAYGLSFAIESLDEQRFPSSVPKGISIEYAQAAKIYGEDTAHT